MTQTTKTSARWYILHVASGSENRIKTLILENAARHDKTEMIEEIVVPTFEVPEFKRGKKVLTEKKYTESDYDNIESVKTGDMIKIMTPYGESVYGIVTGKTAKNKVIFKSYPTIGNALTWEEKFSDLKHLIY